MKTYYEKLEVILRSNQKFKKEYQVLYGMILDILVILKRESIKDKETIKQLQKQLQNKTPER